MHKMNINDIVSTGSKATRDGYGEGIYEAGKRNPKVIAMAADLLGSLKLEEFIEAFPERFVQMGISEANMMGVAAGLATAGKIPFTGTFANFSTGRVYDQIRQSIAYSGKNVKICASHAGLTLGEDGATHQILEDIGLMRMLPGMTVICPVDANQTKQAVLALVDHVGPAYLRFGRPNWPVFTGVDTPFVIGKADRLGSGTDISLFATGLMVWTMVEAAKILESQGISVDVISVPTIKPLDEGMILDSLAKTGCAVVCEEHQLNGGLCDAIAHVAAKNNPTPMEFVAVNDSFGESGKPLDLLKKYGLDAEHIVQAAQSVLKRKK